MNKKVVPVSMTLSMLLFGLVLPVQADTVANSMTDINTSFVGGLLTLDKVPNFDFGSHGVQGLPGTSIDATVDSSGGSPQASVAQVTDLRGTDAGWTLSVTQQAPFSTSANGGTLTLNGALVTFNTINISNTSGSPVATNIPANSANYAISTGSSLSIGAPTLVFQAPVDPISGTGTGTNVMTFGALGTLSTIDTFDTGTPNRVVNPGVTLNIPSNVGAVLAQTYTTTFVWSLQDSPNNIV